MCHVNERTASAVLPTMIVVVFLMLLTNPFASVGYASEVEGVTGKAMWVAACNNTIKAATEKLSPAIAKYPGFKQQGRNFVLLMPVSNFNAFADQERNRILIPEMMCIQTWLMLEAQAHLFQEPTLRDKVLRYVRYLNRRQQKIIALRSSDNVQIKPFYLYAKVPPLDYRSSDGQRIHSALESEMVSAFAFLIGHELGHLVAGDKRNSVSSEESQRSETAADIFSIKLLKESNISLIPALPILHRMLDAEIQYGYNASSSTHPRSECRILRIIDLSDGEVAELVNDPKFRHVSGLTRSEVFSSWDKTRQECGFEPKGHF